MRKGNQINRERIVSRNDITGDALRTKPVSEQYAEGWDRIFGKKKVVTQDDFNEWLKNRKEKDNERPASPDR